jgi:hypothetical protein
VHAADAHFHPLLSFAFFIHTEEEQILSCWQEGHRAMLLTVMLARGPHWVTCYLLCTRCCCLQKDAEAAAAGSLFGRLRGNMAIPSSWTSVLGQVGS